MRSMGLFDATAASQWVSVVDGERRPLYLLLSSTKENGDISLRFLPLLGERGALSRSVVLLDDQATSPSVAVVEEGPRRSPYLSLSSPRRNRCELYLRRIEDSKKRPPGVKASKASGKKTVDPDKQVKEFERIWKIKQKEIDAKEHLSKMSLLDSLIGKKEPLLDFSFHRMLLFCLIKFFLDHGSGDLDKNRREWRVERQTRPRESGALYHGSCSVYIVLFLFCIILFVLCIWSRNLY
ncbi:hypothetical protein DY000_02038955 [Brassica cretica]|uniref:No apical meristem-associated C-terminal domain-containing protein n=1 Tax=Brassica cretica TaxID=69181 RepID=A0ABQ7BD73_BRACR|nr:hypothetical protein DY000_02038955 [Brassica cretica]